MSHVHTDLIYEIVVEGSFKFDAVAQFNCTALNQSAQQTRMTVAVRDQTEIHGVLAIMRDYNVSLVSVNRVDGGQILAAA